ncbi:MAG: haloacid dehalogenase-like hydrolase [Patescibacteria group bacterium]
MNLVHIGDKKSFQNKLDQLKKAGHEFLHVVADFDRTLTRNSGKDGKTYTSANLLQQTGIISKSLQDNIKELYAHYYPIETSRLIPFEERKAKMIEWWTKNYEAFIEAGINRDHFLEAVRENKMLLRPGAHDFIEILRAKNIPLVIFSAGSGDSINFFLEHNELKHPGIDVISNYIEFDKDGRAVGYDESFIHSHNKHESLGNNPVLNKHALERKNVILLGDLIEDTLVADNIDYLTIVKVGFLNENIEDNLDEYKRVFDVVITHDGPMDSVHEILQEIIDK